MAIGHSGMEKSASGGLPLVDLLQVWSMNRFSGLVTVTHGGEVGHIYFVEGEIVHAEAAGEVGEPALHVLLAWHDCSYEPAPNTATLKRTIDKRLSHLLLDAHRVLDERRRDQGPGASARPPPASAHPPAASRDGSAQGALAQVRAIPGVTRLVRFGADGRPWGENGREAESLAAKGLYLAMTHGAAVAQAFGLRELSVATLQGSPESLVVVHSQGNYMVLAVSPDVHVDAVSAQVRTLLARPAR